MIHHSDKGSQYIYLDYIHLLTLYGIRISMCDEPWKNAYTERINRTIKAEYLDGWDIRHFDGLEKAVGKAVRNYNETRPHQSLNWLSPIQFEKMVEKLPEDQRPVTRIYKESTELSTKSNVNSKRK
ncbi:MAG TPA: integrase core domain-containing protein [Chitinophagaceae bacterium]|nr:integrase core domain-containing protein [Chitinophagaceae bacterium]